MKKTDFLKLSKADAVKYIIQNYDYNEVNQALELAMIEDSDGEVSLPNCKPFMYVINMFVNEDCLKEHLWVTIVDNLKQK